MVGGNVSTEQPASSGSMTPEVTGGIATSVRNLMAPLLGMYGGQLLIGFKPELRSWGIAAVAASLLLLVLRLRPRTGGVAIRCAADRHRSVSRPASGPGCGLLQSGDAAMVADLAVGGELRVVILAVSNFRRQAIRLQLTPLRPLDRWDALVLVLLLLGALLLRLPAIETIPWGADPDEGTMAQFAVDAFTGAAKDPFATGWVTHPTLQFFFNGLWVRLFGRTFLAMRLPAMVMGAFAVPAIYLFARVGYGRRIAVMAGSWRWARMWRSISAGSE